jgi:hypothetical protein
MVLTVKSREALDLPPFLFGAENKKSRFSISRADKKAKSADFRPGMGVPCHYENDGSVSYLLTPARPPPSRLAVQQWLSENHATETQNHSSARGERVFTMDANTGKLVPIDEAGSNRSTQESLPMLKISLLESSFKFRGNHLGQYSKFKRRCTWGTPCVKVQSAASKCTGREECGLHTTTTCKGKLKYLFNLGNILASTAKVLATVFYVLLSLHQWNAIKLYLCMLAG